FRCAKAASGNDAKNLATDTLFPSLAVAHDACRGRHDRNAEAAKHLRQLFLAAVYAQARLADALDVFDDRLALVVLEFNGQLGLLAVLCRRKVGDVTFVLKDLGDGSLRVRCRHPDAYLASLLAVTDACQHVGNGVGHTHCSVSAYQLALVSPGISPRIAPSRSLLRDKPNLR